LHPGTRSPSLIALLETALDGGAWDALARGSPIRRAGRAGFARNVCVALGNWGSKDAIPVLSASLRDPDPLVRAHAVWALREIGGPESIQPLEALATSEGDPFVLAEIEEALSESRPREEQGGVTGATGGGADRWQPPPSLC
jgi:epoxyqueuosine reductase